MKIILAKSGERSLDTKMEEFIKGLSYEYEIKHVKMEFLPSFIIKNIIYSFVPQGIEYEVLIRTLEKIRDGEVNLSENTKKLLANIKKDIEIKVFVSPFCHYCPQVVEKLNEFAIFNSKIKTWVIDAFSHDVKKYNILSLPWITINNEPYLSRKFSEEELAFGILKNSPDKDFYRDVIIEGSAIQLGTMIKSEREAFLLTSLLEDEDIKVRVGTILALKEIKDEKILKAVKEKLEEMFSEQEKENIKDDISYALEEIFF